LIWVGLLKYHNLNLFNSYPIHALLIKESIEDNTHLRVRQIDDDRAVGKGEAYVCGE
jgi:hypothetical protein